MHWVFFEKQFIERLLNFSTVTGNVKLLKEMKLAKPRTLTNLTFTKKIK